MDTIEHPLTGEKIRIAKADFSDQMSWDHANAACNALGSGWRLPTKEELLIIAKNRIAIGGFDDSYYWSSSIDPHNPENACNVCILASPPWGQFEDKSCDYAVRAVRSL